MARINLIHGSNRGPVSLALGIALVWLGGCSSTAPVPRRQSGLIVGTQGGGSEVVFPGVEVAALREGQCSGSEYARRDASMNVQLSATAFDNDAWPASPQPSLDGARQLYLPTSPNNYLYTGPYQYRWGRAQYWYGY